MTGVRFGERLRILRMRSLMTQAELASRAGVGRRTIVRLESNEAPTPQPATQRLLADALALDGSAAHWLITGEGDIREPTHPALPAPAGALIGREDLLHVIGRVLDNPATRLLTLTGPGGVGKTSLAMEVAHERARASGTPIHFLPLADLSDPADLLPAIVRELGLQPLGGSARATIARALATTPVFLVLDNLEHLASGACEIGWLLRNAPRLTVLATSRVALRLPQERLVVVEPLSTDDVDGPAVALFLQRARLVNIGYAPGPQERGDIRALCQRLGGLPLAIELGASQMDTLSPRALLSLLEAGGLRALAPNAPGAPPHMASMQDVFAWSWRLLDADQQRLMGAAAAFAGGFDVQGLASVLSLGHGVEAQAAHAEAAGVLPSLLRAHLIRQMQPGTFDEAPRFTLLDPIRDYARDRLRVDGDDHAVRHAHARWAASRLEALDAMVMNPDDRLRGIALMDREYANGLAALRWALGAGEHEIASRLVIGLRGAWGYSDHTDDPGERLTGLGLALSDLAALTPEARRWSVALWLDSLGRAGDPRPIRPAIERSLALARASSDPVLEAMVMLHWSRDVDEDPHDALASIGRALSLLGPDGDTEDPPYLQAWALVRRGVELHRLGCLGEARAAIEAGLRQTLESSHGINAGTQYAHLARVQQDQGWPRLAAESMLEGIGYAVASDDRWSVYHVALWLLRLARAHGGPGAAVIADRLAIALAAEQARNGQPVEPEDILPPAGGAALPLYDAVAEAAALPGLLPERVIPVPGARFTGRRHE